MASKRLNTLKGTSSPRFLNLYSRIRINDFVNSLKGIMKTESIPDKFIVMIEKSIYNCVHSYIMKYQHISSDLCREEFRTASKRHQRNLNSILTYIVQSLKTDRYDTHIYMKDNNIEVKVGTITVMSEDINPRSFVTWYNALKVLQHVGTGLTIENTIVICRVLTSVYNIVNEPELLESEKNLMVNELVDLLSGSHKYSSIDDFKVKNTNDNPLIHEGIEELKETVGILKYYTDNIRLTPPKWANDMVRSLRLLHRDQRLFIFDNTNPMLSTNSTCSSMKYKNKRITIPGLFASCVEPDYFKELNPENNLDNIIGFKQEYNINKEFTKSIQVNSKRRASLAIKQKKPKPRIIHPLNNSEQDRLSYYHNLLARVLSNVRSDCTFNQQSGPLHIKYVMDKHQDWSIYSLDLSSATDTFSLGLQWLVLKDLIFSNMDSAEELSDTWLNIMTSKTSINIGSKERCFTFANGQPQGFLSSFPSFALEHHIVMLTVLRLFDPEMDPEQFYRVLGDDGLLTAKDYDCVLPQLYLKEVNSANVECNLKKGYLYNPRVPKMSVKIAEFAKYLILDGVELTPIPTKLLVTEEKFNNYIGLAAWYSDHRQTKWSVEELKFFLHEMDDWNSKNYSNIIDTMVGLNIPSIFTKSFKGKFDRLMKGHTADDISIAQCLLSNTIVFAAINRLIGNKNLPTEIKTLIHFTKELKPFMDAIDDKSIVSPYNKLSLVKDQVYNTFTTFSEVCRNYSSSEDLSDDDILLICMILQTNNSEVIKDKVNKVLSSIDLLLIDPYKDIPEQEYDSVMGRILELFKGFNISIERSWSTYSRQVPVDYLNNSQRSVNDMLVSKHSLTLSEFVLNNELSIEETPVYNDTLEDEEENSSKIEFGSFSEYTDEDWDSLL